MGHVHKSLGAFVEKLKWKCQISDIFLTIPETDMTYKLRRNKLTAFATWTEKEEAMFLNPETDDYNIYLEDEDRQLPVPFNMLINSFDWSSYVKIHVPLPLEVQ